MSDKDEQIAVRVDHETKEIIAKQLGYRDSMSEWVREAIEERIEKEGLSGNQSQMVMAN